MNKSKRYSRMILALISVILLVGLIPSQVIGISSTHPFGFEGASAPGQYTDAFITTNKEYGMANVSSSNVRTGTRSYTIGYDASIRSGAWFNISGGSYLTNFSFHYRSVTPLGASRFYICLVNRTLAQTNGLVFGTSPLTANEYKKGYLSIVYAFSSGNWYNIDESGNNDVVGSIGSWNTYHKVFINFNNSIGDMYFGLDNTVNGWDYLTDMVSCNGTAVNEGYIADIIYFYTEAPWSSTYLDDCVITLSSSYSGYEQDGCIDLTGLTQVGHFAYTSDTFNYPFMIKKYHVPVTTTIEAVNLECNLAQLSDDGDLAHYGLYINGVYVGMPTCNYVTGDDVVFQWDTNTTLTDECPVFAFYHSQKTSSGIYWKVGSTVYSGGADLDSDGDTTFYFAGSTYTPSSSYPGSYSGFAYGDLGMMWFCTGFTTTTDYAYPDTLGLNYYDYPNATGYVYNINNPKGVVCSYSLSTTSKAYNCRIELWYNGTQTNDYGFPQYINYPSGAVGFDPLNIGKYHFKLYSYHYIANITAWVTGTPENFKISISPKISSQFSTYGVTYRYYHTQGLQGSIGVFDSLLKITDRSKAYHTYPITSNSTATIHYNSNASGAEYWQLFALSTNGWTQVGMYAIHYVRLPYATMNAITCIPNPVKVNEGTKINVKHTMPGSDIGVFINGIKFADVGNEQITNNIYTPTKAGLYNVSLRVNQNGTWMTLNSTLLSVTLASGESPDTHEGITKLVSDLIPKEYRLYVGLGVIIGFTLTPTLIILSYAKQSQAEIHIPTLPLTIVSVIMSLIGFILTIIWGLMPWWSVFLLLFVLILIMGIYIVIGKSASED